MAEWFKAAVLKTVEPRSGFRGFKSYSLRQDQSEPQIARASERQSKADRQRKKRFTAESEEIRFFEL
jgi:secreted protein with Ig-like and vWFA domain